MSRSLSFREIITTTARNMEIDLSEEQIARMIEGCKAQPTTSMVLDYLELELAKQSLPALDSLIWRATRDVKNLRAKRRRMVASIARQAS